MSSAQGWMIIKGRRGNIEEDTKRGRRKTRRKERMVNWWSGWRMQWIAGNCTVKEYNWRIA